MEKSIGEEAGTSLPDALKVRHGALEWSKSQPPSHDRIYTWMATGMVTGNICHPPLESYVPQQHVTEIPQHPAYLVGGLQRYPATQSVIWSLQGCDWLPLVGSAALYHKEGCLNHFKENCLTNDHLSLGSSLYIVGVPQAIVWKLFSRGSQG